MPNESSMLMKVYMSKRIIYIVKSNLAYYPPCMSQIRMIHDLGADIEVWFGSSKDSAKEILSQEGIPYVELVDPRGSASGMLDVLINWKSFRDAVKKRLKTIGSNDVLLWFGTAETAMPMIGALGDFEYVVSALELYDDIPAKKRLLGKLCRNARAVTACEITRAYIMRSWWGLDKVPYVFPNKPYGSKLEKNLPLTCDATKRIIDDLGGREFVIYQGILQNEEYVAEIAKALADLDGRYPLVLMGIDRNGMAPRIKQIFGDTLYYESIPAPRHLEVTSRAHIGVVFYDGSNLNKAFCAPNKIYEYSSFGMPMIANRIPGLLNTVGAAGCAECVDLRADKIADAIDAIDKDYERYSEAARSFFERTNNISVMCELLKDVDAV